MAYLDNSSALISGVITDLGKTILAQNPVKFKIVGYKFSDDEIDYTQSISSILATPIPEPNVAVTAISEFIQSLERNTTRIQTITPSQEKLTLSINTSGNITLETEFLEDEEFGYTIYCNSQNITLNPVDSVVNIQRAQGISKKIVDKLINTDKLQLEKFTEIEKSFEYQSIICKSTFEIESKNVIGKYLLTIVGNSSKSKTQVQVNVKV